jgi:Domain of Unknown Function (DUF1206)
VRKIDFPPNSMKKQAERIPREARRWIVLLARFGFAAQGVVYILIGSLAALAAFHWGGKTTGPHGALVEILSQPYGRIMLGVIAFGFMGYTLWRLMQAIADTEHQGSDAKGLVTRFGYAVSGLIYGGFAVTAVQLLIGTGTHRDEEKSSQEWTATLLTQPLGPWLVGTLGVGIIAFAVSQWYLAYTARFLGQLDRNMMSPRAEIWARRLGRLGLAARGIVFTVIGVFLILAARTTDPHQARGLRGALQALAQQPYGLWVMGVVALGLIAYGVYMLLLARYRRIIL